MGSGQGVEHFQVPAEVALFLHGIDTVTEGLVKGAFTSNQQANAAALSLGTKGPLHSTAPAEEFFAGQIRYGHMSSGPDGVKRNEVNAPAPHSILWGLPLSLLGLWAPDGPLRDAAVMWWAVQFVLCQAFWAPGAGLRAPCGRFLWPRDTDPVPDWTVWSITYARFAGLPEDGLGHAHDVTFDAFGAMLHRLGDEIRAAVASAPVPILAVPIKRWEREGGGYFAAFDGQPPTNDPLAWLEVDPSGRVLNGGKGLDSLPSLSGEPVIIGRMAGASAQESSAAVGGKPPTPQAPLSPVVAPPAPASPAQPQAPPPRAAGAIAADVMRLQVSGKDRSRLREIAMEISGAIKPWRSWEQVADDLLSLGPQHADVQALAAEVRSMGA